MSLPMRRLTALRALPPDAKQELVVIGIHSLSLIG
jgi:hypothetical protein